MPEVLNNTLINEQKITFLRHWLATQASVSEENYELLVQKNLFNSTSNFFNPATILDFFYNAEQKNLTILQTQHFLTTSTDTTVLSTWELTKNVLNVLSYNSNLSLHFMLFKDWSSLVGDSEYLDQQVNTINNWVGTMHTITAIKNDVLLMSSALPEHRYTLEMFDVLSVNVDNSLYMHLHLPETKLYYPEPFIASPSFNHEELWFIHILHYQHWLWFFFISLIMLFFITFINVVRWSNPRNKPKRETRGVSRSKCADLITACVPVSWAAAIIISESVDAADYYDGFGTGEIVVGIRAYQWGWEYFFPRNLDHNYNTSPTYSAVTGNSLKYWSQSDLNNEAQSFWKVMRTSTSTTSNAAHTIISPIDNSKVLNFINFNTIGSRTLNRTNSFRTLQIASKTNQQNLFNIPSDLSLKYTKLNNLYLNDLILQDTFTPQTSRTLTYSSAKTSLNSTNSYLDKKSVDKLLSYNFNKTSNTDIVNYNTLNHMYPLHNQNTLNLTDLKPTLIINKKLKDTDNLFATNKNKLEFNNKTSLITTKLKQSKIVGIGSTEVKNDQIARNLEQTLIKSPKKIINGKKTDTTTPRLNPIMYTEAVRDGSASQIANKIHKTASFVQASHPRSTFLKSRNYNLNVDSFKRSGQVRPGAASWETGQPDFLYNTFWSTLWANSNNNMRLNNIFNKRDTFDQLSLPEITLYSSDYNFRNWQSLEVVEDFIWDVAVSADAADNYLNIKEFSPNHMLIYPLTDVNQENINMIEELQEVLLNSLDLYNYLLTSNSLNLIQNCNTPYINVETKTFDKTEEGVEILPKGWELRKLKFIKEGVNIISGANEFVYNNLDYPTSQILRVCYGDSVLQNDRRFATPLRDFDLTPIHIIEIKKPEMYFNLYERSQKLPELDNPTDSSDDLLYKKNYEKRAFTPSSSFFRYNKFNQHALSFFSEDYYIDPNLLSLNNTGVGDNITSWDDLDGIYMASKIVDYLHYLNYTSTSALFLNNLGSLSYIQVLSTFQENFDEFSETSSFMNELVKNSSLLSEHDIRSTNPVNLRIPGLANRKLFNAYQKLGKAKFDKSKSNVPMSFLSNSALRYPIVSESQTPFKKVLGKNTNGFLTSVSYKYNITSHFNDLSPILNSLNTYFSTLPFLLSLRGESMMYAWVDWYSRWATINVQPAMQARYSLVGFPQITKYFDYYLPERAHFTQSEEYLSRMNRARKNYLSNWALTPYAHNRITNWYATDRFIQSMLWTSNLKHIRLNLYIMDNFPNFPNNFKHLSTPSYMDISSPNRSAWKPTNGVQGYAYSTTTLTNLLSKREYLYREYFLNVGYSITLPNNFIASPTNTLLKEVKNSFNFIDPTGYLSTAQRNFYYESLASYNMGLLTQFIVWAETFTSSNMPMKFLWYLTKQDFTTKFNSSYELYKSQYRPMRKGISNMIKLHATGAISLPTETRLHILASSKDIIHSWSIPSAGIKIDCIPGYSSHRVAIFLVSGVFWGQCMEICGRYHHWMPIIVYFQKLDLFLLWCTHFILTRPNSNREFRPVSHTWYN